MCVVGGFVQKLKMKTQNFKSLDFNHECLCVVLWTVGSALCGLKPPSSALVDLKNKK